MYLLDIILIEMSIGKDTYKFTLNLSNKIGKFGWLFPIVRYKCRLHMFHQMVFNYKCADRHRVKRPGAHHAYIRRRSPFLPNGNSSLMTVCCWSQKSAGAWRRASRAI